MRESTNPNLAPYPEQQISIVILSDRTLSEAEGEGSRRTCGCFSRTSTQHRNRVPRVPLSGPGKARPSTLQPMILSGNQKIIPSDPLLFFALVPVFYSLVPTPYSLPLSSRAKRSSAEPRDLPLFLVCTPHLDSEMCESPNLNPTRCPPPRIAEVANQKAISVSATNQPQPIPGRCGVSANYPENRDSNLAGLAPGFPRSTKARDLGQPPFLIRSALR
jgi:hypothetical protein